MRGTWKGVGIIDIAETKPSAIAETLLNGDYWELYRFQEKFHGCYVRRVKVRDGAGIVRRFRLVSFPCPNATTDRLVYHDGIDKTAIDAYKREVL